MAAILFLVLLLLLVVELLVVQLLEVRAVLAAVAVLLHSQVVLVTRQAHLPHRGQLVGLGVLVEFLPLAAAAAAAVPLV